MGRDRTSAASEGWRVRRASNRPTCQAGFLVRVVVLACVALIGSAWGLLRFYTHVRPPMVVAVTADGGRGERGTPARG